MTHRRFAYLILVLLVIVAVGLSFVGGVVFGHMTASGRAIPTVERPTSDALVDKVRELIKDNYVSKVSDSRLNNGAIDGMMESLKDPYSEYMPAKAFGIFQQHAMGEYFGIGVGLRMNKKKLTVERLLNDDSPARRAGIQAGDVITKIDGKPTAKMTLQAASDRIRGPEGTKVRLDVLRGKKSLTFTIVRAAISMTTIRSEMIGKDVGYIAVSAFTKSTSRDFEKQLERLQAKGAKGIVVDLRFNGGGLVDSAVDLASFFIKDGTIVGMRQQDNVLETMSAVQGYKTDAKLVILVNGDSASASEIVAGAIQDYRRGVIVGTKTYGKASVQTTINLPNGGGLKITTAHYFTPKDRLIQKTGIKPDVLVDSAGVMKPGAKDVQKERAVQVLRELIAGTRKP